MRNGWARRGRLRRWPAAAALVAAAGWAGAWLVHGLPRRDDRGRELLHLWHLTGTGWVAVLVATASVATLVATAWLVVTLPRGRPTSGEPTGARLAAGVTWAALATALVLVTGWSALLADGGPRRIISGPEGVRVLVTQDPFDGDVVALWQPVDAVTWVREPGNAVVSPADGPCGVVLDPDRTTVVRCGGRSQPLGPRPTGVRGAG